MLKEKYNLKQIKDVIKYFNRRENLDIAHLDHELENDIDLEPFNDYLKYLIEEEWTYKNI